MPATIRPAKPSDIPEILAIEQQAPAASHWSYQQYSKLLETGSILVAEDEGAICGFVCARVAADEWEIENIVVAGAFRRRGVASELLRRILDKAGPRPGSAVFLEGRDSNLPARRFYEKHGFQQVGRRPRYYQKPEEDAILYRHRLPPSKSGIQ